MSPVFSRIGVLVLLSLPGGGPGYNWLPYSVLKHESKCPPWPPHIWGSTAPLSNELRIWDIFNKVQSLAYFIVSCTKGVAQQGYGL